MKLTKIRKLPKHLCATCGKVKEVEAETNCKPCQLKRDVQMTPLQMRLVKAKNRYFPEDVEKYATAEEKEFLKETKKRYRDYDVKDYFSCYKRECFVPYSGNGRKICRGYELGNCPEKYRAKSNPEEIKKEDISKYATDEEKKFLTESFVSYAKAKAKEFLETLTGEEDWKLKAKTWNDPFGPGSRVEVEVKNFPWKKYGKFVPKLKNLAKTAGFSLDFGGDVWSYDSATGKEEEAWFTEV